MTYCCSGPCLLVEVFSESTARIDRRQKRLAYQRIPSLREYPLIEQDTRAVEIHRSSQGWGAEYLTRWRRSPPLARGGVRPRGSQNSVLPRGIQCLCVDRFPKIETGPVA